MDDTPDTPAPDEARAVLHAWLDPLDPAVLVALYRFLYWGSRPLGPGLRRGDFQGNSMECTRFRCIIPELYRGMPAKDTSPKWRKIHKGSPENQPGMFRAKLVRRAGRHKKSSTKAIVCVPQHGHIVPTTVPHPQGALCLSSSQTSAASTPCSCAMMERS
jgi:hypothetical protein